MMEKVSSQKHINLARVRILTTLVLALLFLFVIPVFNIPAQAATYPTGFIESLVSGNIALPTALEFAPDGRIFVTQKNGQLRIIKNGTLLPTPFLTVSVNEYIERGLTGVTFDPDFANNRYVYIYYTRSTEPIKNRLSRFTADINNPDIADPNSEVILIDNIASDSGMHNAGALHFGNDGKLYIAVGDAGVSSNAQDLSNLSGKILRINKDGSIPSDNPYFNQVGKRGEIWANGLRNPFTFAIDKSSGKMFINDVGQDVWEEINLGTKAANFGWPTCEGGCSTPGMTNPVYSYYHPIGFAITGGAFYEGTQFPSEYFGDYFFADYGKGWIKKLDQATNQVTDFVEGLNSPVDLEIGSDGALYYVSINNGAIYKIAYSSTNPSPTPTPNPSQGDGLTGYYFNNQDFTGDRITKIDPQINFDWGMGMPHPSIDFDTFSVIWVGEVLPQYSESYTFYTSTDDGVRLWVDDKLVIDKFTYQGATEHSGSVALTAGAKAKIRMEYFEGYVDAVAKLSWSSPSTVKQIIPQSQLFTTTDIPPVANIITPSITLYQAGDTINFSGTGTDEEDGEVPDSAFSWTVVFHHDTHTHPFLGPVTNTKSGSFQIPQTGETSANVWYRVYLKVTDSAGFSHIIYKDIVPNKVNLTLQTNPLGLSIELDGQPKVTPFSLDSVVNFTRNLNALSPQIKNGKSYQFSSWSDSGSQNHNINTPSANTAYIANFIEENDEPGLGDGLLGTYFNSNNFTGTSFSRVDPMVDFNWGQGVPHPSISSETFSVRWIGQLVPKYSENYTFYTTSDDGVKLWVNDQLVIDKFIDQSATEHFGNVNLVGGQKVNIKLEYYDNYIDAVAKLSWSAPSQLKEVVPTAQLFSSGVNSANGLNAIYYDNNNLTGFNISKADSIINFDWGTLSPTSGIDPETFSVRWTGFIEAPVSGSYTFYTTTDDGVKLFVNDQLVIDKFIDQSATEHSGTITLVAGQKYPLVMEFYDNYIDAVAKLSWSYPGTAKQIIPQNRFFTK